MTMPAFPSITINYDKPTYREKPDRNVASFAVDIGPALESRMSAVASTLINVTLVCQSSADFDSLMTFYTTTCKDGVFLFTMTHPRLGTSGVFKFEDAPELTQIRGNWYFVSLSLRYFP